LRIFAPPAMLAEEETLAAAAKRVDARLLLTGSLRSGEHRMRLIVQVTHRPDSRLVSSRSYDRGARRAPPIALRQGRRRRVVREAVRQLAGGAVGQRFG